MKKHFFLFKLIFLTIFFQETVSAQCPADGITWTARPAAENNTWESVTYGKGLFVAVASGGTNRIMTSPDGITWTARTITGGVFWQSVTYANDLFVAVGSAFSSANINRVMTSPDGINWTLRTATEANDWHSVTYGNGLFVAVASNGTNRVMTSPNGIDWTARTAAAANRWNSVTYGNDLFVAVAEDGTNRVMTSTDGINWTARTAAAANPWNFVTYGNGLFVAVASSGTNRVMTSPDGTNWTARTAEDNDWRSVTYGNGIFVALAQGGTNRVMTSSDGITWVGHTVEDSFWNSVVYGNGLFVAVAKGGTNRVMTNPGVKTPTVSIASDDADNSITTGTSVTFTATPTNGGSTPAYQWKKNGNNVGTNSATYTDAALVNDDKITCVLTSNDACASPTTATSNEITMTVTTSVVNGPTCTSFTNKTTANGLGHNSVYRVYVVGNTIYAATNNGLSISTDGGSSFTNRTTANGLGHNTVYSVYVVGNTVYAATNNGLSISTDGGTSFTNRTTANGLAGNFIYDVFVVGNTIYAATSNSGLSISTDGGTSFVTKSINDGLTDYYLYGVCAVNNTVYVATYSGLSISTDGGATFTGRTTANGLGSNYVYGVYAEGNTVYAATSAGLSISTNGGANFTNKTIANGLGSNALVGVFAMGNTVYAATDNGLSISTDGGANFTNYTTANGLGNFYVYSAFAAGSNVYAATDNGLSFCCPSTVTPSVSILSNDADNSITSGTSVTFTATPTNGGTTPAYQWKKNGNDVGTNSAAYTDAALANGDKITCVLTSNAACASPTTATSNEITMTVCSPVTPAVSIAANPGNSITAGTSVTFTATPTDGGTTPAYQWKKNGNEVGTNSATYTDAALANDDKITCVLTSNAACASPATATSNEITMTVAACTVVLQNITVSNFGVSGNNIYGGTYTLTGTENGAPKWAAVYTSLLWSSTNNRWEILYYSGSLMAYNTTGSIYNLPCTGWVANSAISGLSTPALSGGCGVVGCPSGNCTPSVSIASDDADNSITSGTSVTFTATPTDGGTTPAYQWKKNGNDVGTNSAAYTDGALANGDKITCVLTSNDACASPTTATSNEITIAVTTPCPPGGETWTARSAAEANFWFSLTYGNGLFVAVATSGTNRVMTSSDGITWTARTAAAANSWNSVTYGNGLFVTVGSTGSNRVMTSPDGITWTARTAAAANSWISVTYGNGLFVAVAIDGTSRVMTSPDGITWTARTAAEANPWNSVTYGTVAGNSLFVAVSNSGTNRVMTSPDGITWTAQIAAEANPWYSVTYGNGLFVAVASGGTNRVMTSPDGATWTARTAAEANSWGAVTYGNGLFVAIASGGTNRVMTSPDGATWTARTAAEANSWKSVTYGNGLFAAVSSSGTNRVMTSGIEPSVSIASDDADNSITSGTSVTFTATPTNGGSTPGYQWKKNGNEVGTNSATYTDGTLVNGDKITCVLTSNAACASPATATSNEVTMSVTTPNGPACSSYTTKTNANGLGNNYVNNMYAVGNTVYAATFSGLSISTDGGASFSNKTTANGLGNNTTYAVYASGSNIYVATQNGVGISTNSGVSFTNKTNANGLGSNNIADVYAVGNTIYAATGNGLGISTDGGANFSNKTTANGLGNNLVQTVYVANDIIYAGTFGGLSISTNGGTNFVNKTTANGLGDNYVSDVYVVGSTVYAATVSGLSISTNGGASFVNKTTAQGLGDNFVIGVFAMGNTIYAATIGGLSISTNGGTSFTNYTTANGLGTNDMRAAFATANTVYVGTNGGGLSFCTASNCTPVTPSVTIASDDADNIVTTGTSVTFTATPTNGGSTPGYQWKKNGNDVGTNSATYTDGALADGDKIKVIMTSNDACASPATATSNEITMTVTPACATPTAYNLTGGGAYCAGGTGVAIGLASSQTGVNYQLQRGNANVGNPVAGTGNALSFGIHTDAGTYTVVATSATGSCSANMNGNATVTGIPLPTAYNVTGGGSYCAGGAGVPVGLANSESGVSYQLKKDNNPVGNPVAGTGAAISFGNQTAPGTYTVEAIKNLPSPVRIGLATGVLAPPPSGGNCTVTMTGSVSITSVTPPSANAGADKTTCGTAAVALVAVGTGQWSGGMGTFSDVNSPTATYTPAAGEVNPSANNTVTLTWTFIGTTPCANATDQMTVTVRPPASANAGADKTTCGTTAVALTPMGTVLGGTAIWSGGTGSFSDANNPFTTYTPAQGEVGTTVTLTLSIGGGPFCSNATDQMTVTVASPAAADAGPDKTTCGTAAVALAAVGNGKWSGGMGSFSDANNPTATYTPALSEAGNTIALTWTITGTPPCPNSTDQMTLTVKSVPASALTASQYDVCPNTEVTLDAHCSIPTATVNWNPGASTVTPNAATLPYIYKASCTADGCTGNESSIEVRTHRILVDMKDLDVGTLPKAIVRAVKDNMAPTNLIEAPLFPRRWTFIANACEASESAAFSLSGPVNFNTVDNAAPYVLFANDANGFYSIDHPNYGNGGSFPNGTYTLTVDLRSRDGVGGPFPKNRVATGSLLATRTLQFTVVGPSSARQAAADNKLFTVQGLELAEIFPNPVTGTMRLKVNHSKGQAVNVNMIDASGRTLLQSTFVPQTNSHQEEFAVSHLNNGMYFLKVNAGDKQVTLKVIKLE